MSDSLERFREDAAGAADEELAEALGVLADQLEFLRRRNLVAFEVGMGDVLSLSVKAARAGQAILWIEVSGSVGMWHAPPSIDVETWSRDRAIVDPGVRTDVLAFVEARALELLRDPEEADSGPKEDLVGVREHTGKYRKLWRWLCDQDRDVIPMTFTQIEEILGMRLPPSSRKHPAHWSGYDNSAVSRAIVDAGFKTRKVDLANETVEFYRASR